MVSLCLNVILAQRVSNFRQLAEVLKDEQRLTIGVAVPPIPAKDLDGRKVPINYDQPGRTTILYVFSPSCSWCGRNIANIKAIASLNRSGLRLIGLSLSDKDLKDYVAQNNLNFPVYSGIPGNVKQAYRLSGTPQTIVVSDQGRVIKTWMGAYSGELQKEVEDYLQVSLPGIVTPNQGTQ